MATPTSMNFGSLTRPDYGGITLEAYPSTQARLSVDIQQATANSTASSKWTSTILPPTSSNTLRYTARVPLSTKTWYFRARHPAQPGYSAGPFTATVMAKPVLVPVIMPRIVPQLTYAGNVEVPAASDIWVSSGRRVKVGSQVTSGTIKKQVMLGYESFQPESTGTPATYNGALALTAGSATTYHFNAHLPLPIGAALKQLSISGNRKSTSNIVKVVIFRSTAITRFASSQFAVSLTKSTAFTLQTADSSALNFTVGTSDTWHMQLSLKNTTSDATMARLFQVRWKYEMPSYDKSI